MSEVDVATPAAPVIPTGTPSRPGPSVREGTIAITEAFGPKRGNYVSAAELAARERAKLSTELQNPAAAPHVLLPSVRESTIAMTEQYGPKTANHVPASELPKSQTVVPVVDRPSRYPEGPTQKTPTVAATPASEVPSSTAPAPAVEEAVITEAAEPAAAPEVSNAPATNDGLHSSDGKLPSVRESTIAATEQNGPKVGHHVPPSELPAEQTAIPEVGRPSSQVRHSTATSLMTTTVAAVAEPPSAVPVAETGVPELMVQDAAGRLPSTRESTIAMTQRYGPKQPNHVPPSGLSKPTTATPPAAAAVSMAKPSGPLATPAPAPVARVRSDRCPHAVTVPAAKDVQRAGSGSLRAKPIREWRAQDVKQAAAQMADNKVFMTALAVGAAALTVFSVYKGVSLYNHYRLNQSIAAVERERPTVVHLYIHRRSPLAPSVSMPCTRVETLLRLARVPYEAHVISDTSVSPNGELPFIVFSGLRIAEPLEITNALARELDANLDRDLSPQDQATGVALLSAVRYSLTRGYMRSVHVDRPDVMKPYYSEMNRTPDWVTWFSLRCMQRQLTDVNETSGYSQLSSEQYVRELLRDVRAMEALLEHHTYLFSSDYPCSYDCALYAWLLPVVAMEDAAEVNEAFAYIVESELLTNYVRRMTELAFPDLDELVYGQLEEGDREEGGAPQHQQQQLTSEEERSSYSREQSRSQTSSPSGRRPRMRLSESRRRTTEPGAADEDGEADLQTRPSQREMRLPGER
ncbi:putative mitochondrial hypothetical protein [Leptomonas pyrrhocoris]|uniref:Thioredoxin-like fold domain-containing protein n=1 Tax=Leptomonas pyrrhocoris TaxID=157538 RepID=A0A0M9FZM4_LEPPY|nr:putative mitochondrial hypothetical protein [Leptomonas pyrrhocoris]KPA79243.1 putative mitochondrial hypothetical protein [Leptomonas pyrrhocoris]|eukprot:XP_015657682.1 putative mitochondrial hypothetical protein [Leptomonas pyrrhocoris]